MKFDYGLIIYMIKNLYLTHIPKHNIKRNSNWKENDKSWYYMCNIKWN